MLRFVGEVLFVYIVDNDYLKFLCKKKKMYNYFIKYKVVKIEVVFMCEIVL